MKDINNIVSLIDPIDITIIKRDGKPVSYDRTKIRNAILNAYLDCYGLKKPGIKPMIEEAMSLNDIANAFSEKVTINIEAQLQDSFLNGKSSFNIEDIQNYVEEHIAQLDFKVARSYILYRENRSKIRSRQNTKTETLYHNDKGVLIDLVQINHIFSQACEGIEAVDPLSLTTTFMEQIYEGISELEINNAMVISAKQWVENNPFYSNVAARLLLRQIQQEVFELIEFSYTENILSSEQDLEDWKRIYPSYFKKYIAYGIHDAKRLDPKFGSLFDLDVLAHGIKPERDYQFDLLGLQTLFDRYLLHTGSSTDIKHYELPQAMFMRVAMGLAIHEDEPTERAMEFYDLLSSFDFMSSTPTLFNSGTIRPQLSSCYLTTVPDDMEKIASSWTDNALLQKWAGGVGNDWTPVRANGALIQGTNGLSQGVIPFLKVTNDIAVSVNQGGKRKGAVCSYLETWHLDIEDFLELRKNTGDERRRTHDMNTANWIPDLFMKRVQEQGKWSLFSPHEVPDLHDLYGQAFERRYLEYERQGLRGDLSQFRQVDAMNLWKRMIGMIFETGHPWITFKDPCNIRSPQSHDGVVHSSNLCTEITLNTNENEIAVCNLGSINVPNHIVDGLLDINKLRTTIQIAMRMLDNVIDINYYSRDAARNSNLKHRPVGLGLMGYQDALVLQNIPVESNAAVSFADTLMEHISYYALESSCDLAQERGAYESFGGSLWFKGILPIDSLDLLEAERGEQYTHFDRSTTLDWESLRKRVKHGIRNSNCLAIAPTATISNICGVSQSIEPIYQNLYVKSNLSGEFTVINRHLYERLKERGLWNPTIVSQLKYYDGSVQSISEIPDEIKSLFKTAFEVDQAWLIRAAARRQKWIDQSQSLNLYVAQPKGKHISDLYFMAWQQGLKTTYYLRSLAATQNEKSVDEPTKLCTIDNPDCESCQ